MHGHTRLRLIRRGKDVQRHNPLGAMEGECGGGGQGGRAEDETAHLFAEFILPVFFSLS